MNFRETSRRSNLSRQSWWQWSSSKLLLSLGWPTVDRMKVFNRRRAEKLHSADADVAGKTRHSVTKRTTSLNIRAAPSVNCSTEATSLTVVGTDVSNRLHNIISCASNMSWSKSSYTVPSSFSFKDTNKPAAYTAAIPSPQWLWSKQPCLNRSAICSMTT